MLSHPDHLVVLIPGWIICRRSYNGASNLEIVAAFSELTKFDYMFRNPDCMIQLWQDWAKCELFLRCILSQFTARFLFKHWFHRRFVRLERVKDGPFLRSCHFFRYRWNSWIWVARQDGPSTQKAYFLFFQSSFRILIPMYNWCWYEWCLNPICQINRYSLVNWNLIIVSVDFIKSFIHVILWASQERHLFVRFILPVLLLEISWPNYIIVHARRLAILGLVSRLLQELLVGGWDFYLGSPFHSLLLMGFHLDFHFLVVRRSYD